MARPGYARLAFELGNVGPSIGLKINGLELAAQSSSSFVGLAADKAENFCGKDATRLPVALIFSNVHVELLCLGDVGACGFECDD